MRVILIACQFVVAPNVGLIGTLTWCKYDGDKYDGCLLKMDAGFNWWLPKECYKCLRS